MNHFFNEMLKQVQHDKYYNEVALNVSPCDKSPVSNPFLNQRIRCADVPCVNESGTTRPVDCFCKRSSPIALAAFMASSKSPVSIILVICCEWCAQTPARKSA